MNAITVSVSGDSPAEVAGRLRAPADALTPTVDTPTGGGLHDNQPKEKT